METYIKISTLNDFIFCPKSIYFHELYNKYNQSTYHWKYQTEWKLNHESIDKWFYSNKKDILQWITVYSHKYKLLWKIDIYDKQTKTLIERKTNIKKIYLGYIYQLWAQYLCMQEMWFKVEKIQLYSLKTNKKFDIELPKWEELKKFKTFLQKYQNFNIKQFKQKNPTKCQMCIYRTLCDIAL
jgi:CRISPR-associated exonuclease Cas4